LKKTFAEKILEKNLKKNSQKNISQKKSFENKSIFQKKFNQSLPTSTHLIKIKSISTHFTHLSLSIYHRKKQALKRSTFISIPMGEVLL